MPLSGMGLNNLHSLVMEKMENLLSIWIKTTHNGEFKSKGNSRESQASL